MSGPALPELPDLIAQMAATWPPEAVHRVGPWALRQGPGGGSRVTCATAEAPVTAADLAPLEAAARALGQGPRVMVRAGEEALDAMLAAAGWRLGDEVVVMAAPPDRFAPPPHLTAFAVWPPVGIQPILWAETGIGPERLAIMARAPAPKAALLGRTEDRAAGTGFVAVAGGVAFLHAMVVLPALRRKGTARHMLAAAAEWAREAGARTLALAVTRDNAAARALYAGEGMEEAGAYHYRLP